MVDTHSSFGSLLQYEAGEEAADAAEESEAPTPDVPPSRPLGTGPESPQLPRK